MANDNAVIQYESGQTAYPFEITTTTDDMTFGASFKPWTGVSGFEPVIAPSGVVNGGVLSASTIDAVMVATALISNAGAVGADEKGQITVVGASVACARPSIDTHIIYSITVDSLGDLVAVAGTEGTGFSEDREVAGGAPLIAIDSVEIGQVRYATQSVGILTSNEIKQVPGSHRELSDFPVYSMNTATGEITFANALPLIHTGDITKQVYISGYTPIFVEVPKGSGWSPSELTHSVNSKQVYGGTIGSVASSIGQASFDAVLKDGTTDNIISAVDKLIWIKFKQDRNKVPYQLTQGKLGIARSYPADDDVNASFTVSSEAKTVDYSV